MRSDHGRHRLPAGGRPGRSAAVLAVLGSAVILGTASVLPAGAHTADPIDADPVSAFATVVSAPSCTAATTPAVVELTVPGGTVTRATLDACGLPTGQRVAVEYRDGAPGAVRLAGTSTAGPEGVSGRWVAAGAGVAALLAVIVGSVLIPRRRPRPAGVITVAELVDRFGGSARSPRPHATAQQAPPARVLETAGRR